MEFPATPHVDTERLQLNVTRLKALHRVGAFAASHVSSYEGDTTEVVPTIAGINSDGSAIAGGLKIAKKAQKSKGDYIDPMDVGLPIVVNDTFGRTFAAHRLNRPELASCASDRVREGDATSETAWAKELDVALRQSMRRSGRKHLMDRYGKFSLATSVMAMSYGAIFLADLVTSQNFDVRWLTSYTSAQVIMQAFPLIVKQKCSVHADRRWSLAPWSMQPDRYIALNGLSRMPGLIRAQK